MSALEVGDPALSDLAREARHRAESLGAVGAAEDHTQGDAHPAVPEEALHPSVERLDQKVRVRAGRIDRGAAGADAGVVRCHLLLDSGGVRERHVRR